MIGVYGQDSQVQPKETIIEAEDNEYLLTAQMGSDMSQDDFAIKVSQIETASSKAAVTGIDDVHEGVLFGKAPEASSISLRYAAVTSGSMGLYINGKRQDLYLPETGNDTTFVTVSVPVHIKKGDLVSIQFDKGDTSISLDYIIFNDLTIKDIEKVDVATLVGEAPVMPSKVNVVYSDGTKGVDGVKWNVIDKELYSKPGTLEIEGKLVSNGAKVTAIVHVYDQNGVVRIKPAYIALAKGLTPRLPETIEVYFENGLCVEKEVVWDEADPNTYSKTGQYEIKGAIKGINEKAIAQITVFDNFPEGTSDLAFGKKVTASGENSVNYVTNINDGDISTRWESAVNKGAQWVEIDLEKEYSVGSMDIFWETACAKSYSISVSANHKDWTTIYETTTGKGGTEKLKFDNVASGRYVRIHFTEYGYDKWNAYSIYEIHLFQAPYAQNYVSTKSLSIVSEKDILTHNGESIALKTQFNPKNVSIDSVIWKVTDTDGNPTDCAEIDYTGVLKAKKDGIVKVTATTVDGSNRKTEKNFMILGQSSGNLALNKSAISNGCYTGSSNSYAVDGDSATRWIGKWNTNFHWYQVDLGEPKEINSLRINWENAYSKKYKIFVSNAEKADSWTEVYSTTSGAGGIETIEFDTVTARHVKLESTEAQMSKYGISIWEFEVFNTPKVKVSSSNIADLVKQMVSPGTGINQLDIPTYDGFDIHITSSSNENIVKKRWHYFITI